jgi:hypothetical protein
MIMQTTFPVPATIIPSYCSISATAVLSQLIDDGVVVAFTAQAATVTVV